MSVLNLVIFLLLVSFNFSTFAVSDTAKALVIVEKSLAISQVSDLDFGTVVQGDLSSQVVPPGNSENASNASFLVTGEANKNVTINLPASAIMKKGFGGSADTEIAVNSFQSTPSGTGTLSGSGSLDLFVGATRNGLTATQESGAYQGSFSVEVVY